MENLQTLIPEIWLENLTKIVQSFLQDFLNKYNLFEQIVFGIAGLLVVYFLVMLVVMIFKFLFGIKSFFIPKGIGRQLKTIKNGKLINSGSKNHIGSKNKEQVGFFEGLKMLNKARKLAIIERNIKQDKPIRLSLTEAIFMIQNYQQYNFFASEDGKVLFERVKKEIQGTVVNNGEMFSLLQSEDKEALKLLSEDRLKVLVKDNVEFHFNEDGNIVAFKNKDEEQQKSLAKSIKKIEDSIQNSQTENTPIQISEQAPQETPKQDVKYQEQNTPAKTDEKNSKKIADKIEIQTTGNIATKKTASDYKKEKQSKKALDKQIVYETMSEDKFEQLSNLEPEDFFSWNDEDENAPKKKEKNTSKQNKKKNAQIPEQEQKTEKQETNEQESIVEQKETQFQTREKQRISIKTLKEQNKAFELIDKILSNDAFKQEYISVDKERNLIHISHECLRSLFKLETLQEIKGFIDINKKKLKNESDTQILAEKLGFMSIQIRKEDFLIFFELWESSTNGK